MPTLNWLGGILLVLGIVSVSYLIARKAWTGEWLKGPLGASLAVLAIGGLIVVPMTGVTGGQAFWNTEITPKEEVTGPQEQITKTDTGVVKGNIIDEYMEPTTQLSNVTLDVGTVKPTRQAGVDSVVTTTENGSYTAYVPHITSGTVYVTASKSGYYPSIESTTIPGASEFPPQSLYVTNKLAQIETSPTIEIDDKSGTVSKSTTTIQVDNDAATQTFDLRLIVPSAYKCLRDVQETFVRGDDWDNVDALSVMVKNKPSGLNKDSSGDITLANDYTAALTFEGDLKWSQVIELRIQVSHDVGPTGLSLAKIQLNDLFDADTVKGNSGWAGTTLTIQTADI